MKIKINAIRKNYPKKKNAFFTNGCIVYFESNDSTIF